MDVLVYFGTLVPDDAEQVIEVPTVVCPPRAARTVLCAPQPVEQLVEVPTPVFYSSLLQRMEQNVDIPVPHRAGRIADLQGFLPRQSSTALQERISERLLEQMIDCVPGGGPQGFRPGQSSSSSSHRPAGISEDTDEPGDGVFRAFPRGRKSAEVAGQVSADLPRHVSSWTPAAYVQPRGVHEQDKEKEKEKKRLAAHDEATAVLERARLFLEGKRRKRKKRRKRRTPRTSSHSSRSRARLRQRQWYTSWLVFYRSRCVPFFLRQAQDASAFWLVWTRRTGMLRG